MAPLDDIADEIGLRRMDILKMDIEGGECAALRGMERTLRRLRPRALAIEIEEFRLQQAGTSRSEIVNLLAGCGLHPTGEVLLTNEIFATV